MDRDYQKHLDILASKEMYFEEDAATAQEELALEVMC